MAFAPARIHALEHLRPILAFGAARAGVDFDIGAVGVGLAGEQGGDLVALGALGEVGEAADAVIDQGLVALALGELDQFDRVGELALDRARRGDRLLEPAAFAHNLLRRLGIVPQRRILDHGVELVEPLERAVPVEEAPQQCGRGVDLVDMGLRFGAHRSMPSYGEAWQAAPMDPPCVSKRLAAATRGRGAGAPAPSLARAEPAPAAGVAARAPLIACA